MAPQSPDVARIEHAIDGVLDPCSRFNGTNVSFIELGMIDAIEVGDDGDVLIHLFLDDPTCLYLSVIRREIREAVLAVPGVARVEFKLVYDRIWTEAELSERGREKLERSRASRRAGLLQIANLLPSASAPQARAPQA